MEPEAVGKIIDQLFLQLPTLVVTTEGPLLLTEEEIDAAVDRVCAKAKKALGPEGIPNSVWTIVHWANSGILDTVFNAALKSGVLPTQWKVSQLVLLRKSGKPIGHPPHFGRSACWI